MSHNALKENIAVLKAVLDDPSKLDQYRDIVREGFARHPAQAVLNWPVNRQKPGSFPLMVDEVAVVPAAPRTRSPRASGPGRAFAFRSKAGLNAGKWITANPAFGFAFSMVVERWVRDGKYLPHERIAGPYVATHVYQLHEALRFVLHGMLYRADLHEDERLLINTTAEAHDRLGGEGLIPRYVGVERSHQSRSESNPYKPSLCYVADVGGEYIDLGAEGIARAFMLKDAQWSRYAAVTGLFRVIDQKRIQDFKTQIRRNGAVCPYSGQRVGGSSTVSWEVHHEKAMSEVVSTFLQDYPELYAAEIRRAALGSNEFLDDLVASDDEQDIDALVLADGREPVGTGLTTVTIHNGQQCFKNPIMQRIARTYMAQHSRLAAVTSDAHAELTREEQTIASTAREEFK